MHQYKVGDLIRFKNTKEISRVEDIRGKYIKVRSTTDKDITHLIPEHAAEQYIERYIEPYRFRNLIGHDYFLVAMAVVGAIAIIVNMALN
jgi:hypothetical protein